MRRKGLTSTDVVAQSKAKWVAGNVLWSGLFVAPFNYWHIDISDRNQSSWRPRVKLVWCFRQFLQQWNARKTHSTQLASNGTENILLFPKCCHLWIYFFFVLFVIKLNICCEIPFWVLLWNTCFVFKLKWDGVDGRINRPSNQVAAFSSWKLFNYSPFILVCN